MAKANEKSKDRHTDLGLKEEDLIADLKARRAGKSPRKSGKKCRYQ